MINETPLPTAASDTGLLSGSSSPDPATYILAGIVCGIAVDVVLVLAEKSYQAVKYFLTQKENK